MQIINSIVSWLITKRLHQIKLFRDYPHDVQRETFFKLLQKAEKTEFGKKHGFGSIKTVQDFKSQVPIHTYEQIEPYITRLMKGEQNILWPSEIKWFAKSSGTTNSKSKFIPVSKEALEECHFRGGKDILALYTDQNPNTNIFSGKSLTLGGSHQISNFNSDSFYGDLSAILIENLPFWANFIRTPSQEIALLSKWEEKLDKITKTTIKENVTNIAGVPSWNLVLIRHILEHTGKSNLLELWPNLELFTHGGISFAPYRKQFEQLIPTDKMNYLETYNASEGFFAIQDEPNDSSMLLMLDYGIFYEFIPLENIHGDNPKTLTLDEVETDKNYAIVISTNGGLWRYMIGDTVTFTSKYPYKIKITGRTKHFINAFGEEIIIDNTEKALQIACEKTNAQIFEYTVAPIYMSAEEKGCHEWLIEFEKPPKNLDFFRDVLDHALMGVNSDYEAKRYKNITLAPPTIKPLQSGSFHEWLRLNNKLGGQNKVPRLSNSRKYVDELLKINCVNTN